LRTAVLQFLHDNLQEIFPALSTLPAKPRALLEGMRTGFEKNYMWRHAWAILLAAEGKRTDALQAMDEGTLKFAQLTWAVTSTTADFYALTGDNPRRSNGCNSPSPAATNVSCTSGATGVWQR
jgi:hypothetical protein